MFSMVYSYLWGSPVNSESETAFKENAKNGEEVMEFAPPVVKHDQELAEENDWIFVENVDKKKGRKISRVPEAKTKPFLPNLPANQVQPPPPTLHAVPEPLPPTEPPTGLSPNPQPMSFEDSITEDPHLEEPPISHSDRRWPRTPEPMVSDSMEEEPTVSEPNEMRPEPVEPTDIVQEVIRHRRRSNRAHDRHRHHGRTIYPAGSLRETAQLVIDAEAALDHPKAIQAQQKIERKDRRKALSHKQLTRVNLTSHAIHPTKRSQRHAPQTRSGVSNNRSHC